MADESPRLDPQTRALLARIAAAAAPPLHTLTPAEARRVYRESRKALAPPPAQVAEVRELSLPGPATAMRARVYRAQPQDGRRPGVVYFHGGGFIYGDVDTHDGICRAIARSGSCVVVSVDYRLAPEHRFPAAAEDALAATRWVSENAAGLGIDPERLVVAGDSAGGNLAAGVALASRDAGGPAIAMQILVYPVTDFAEESESVARFAEGYLLTRESMRWVKRTYLPDPADALEWRASPLRARDFSRLPPAYIIVAGFDPLRDEGTAYAQRLLAAGGSATLECFEGQVHGFLMMGGVLAAAGHAVQRIGQMMRMRFGAQARLRP